MAVNITRYNNILLYTVNGQAVNHSSPYAGFRFNCLKMKKLSFQSRTNPLRLSSNKVGYEVQPSQQMDISYLFRSCATYMYLT